MRIDLIIPTVAGREDSLARCVDSYERNTAPGVLNVIVIRGRPTVGIAWQEGIEQSTASYVHLSCDDLEMVSPVWAGACVEVADSGRLPCPVVRRPDGSLESCGGDMRAPACLISQLQNDGTEVDFTTVPFGTREQVEAIGMHDGHYLTDTYFSHKGRNLGWPTVVTTGYEFIHHHSNVGRLSPNTADSRIYAEAMRG